MRSNTGPSFPTVGTNNVCDPTLPPPCAIGWQGAATAGIFAGNLNLPSTAVGTISNYKIQVDEYTQPGGNGTTLTFVKTVLNRTLTANLSSGGIPSTGYIFDTKTVPIYYFTNNYDLIKNRYVYKVTYSATSSVCGTLSSYSYFKILDDGQVNDPNGGVNWRMANPNAASNAPSTITANSKFKIYPNPASNALHLSWVAKEAHTLGTIVISDMLGKVVARQYLNEATGQNNASVDISRFAPGIYHYTVSTGAGIEKGNFVKQ